MKADIAGQPSEQLQRISERLLFEHNKADLRNAAIDLHALFSRITGLQDDSTDPAETNETILESGKALSPKDAARCILDFARTATFLRGIHAAILELQKRFAAPIEILYAGCGPFAPLALPIATRFTTDEIKFTLLDIHARSLSCAGKLIETFGLSSSFRELIQTDAATYVHSPKSKPHLLIIECLQRALEHEPQVAITRNLAPQLSDDGILIPEKVTVRACLYDPSTEFQFSSSEGTVEESRRVRVGLGCVFELTQETTRKPEHDNEASKVRLAVPSVQNHGLMLQTTVTVFQSNVLSEYVSGITYPQILHDLGSSKFPAELEFNYILGRKPGFRYRWIT